MTTNEQNALKSWQWSQKYKYCICLRNIIIYSLFICCYFFWTL